MNLEMIFLFAACCWWMFDNVRNARLIDSLNAQLATTAKHNGDLQTKIAGLEKTLADWRQDHKAEWAECSAELAELNSENERLESQLSNAGIKPADVQAAEHDNVGAVLLTIKE